MLVKTNDHDVVGDMPGQAVDMSLSNDSLEHIMDILSDLYSNRPAAIIREYTTNALDSHIISGQTKPVEIRTPNRLSPNLVIQDFGNGMSKQTLIDTYSKYGASTKRGNNLEAGQLGLGSKSGFAYTDQFTVRSVHDGHCCELIMSRNDRGAAEMTIAFDYETTDESGVTITIPIKTHDITSVIDAAAQFAMFATPGTISLNGEINERPENWIQLSDTIYSAPNLESHMIVMGNVAYPAKLFPNIWMSSYENRIVAFVEMGDVDFAPSREALKYTPYTQKTIDNIESLIEEKLVDKIKDSLDKDDSRISKIASYKLYREWRQFITSSIGDDIIESVRGVEDGTKHITARLPHNIDDPGDKIRNSGSKHKYNMDLMTISNYMEKTFYAVTDFPGIKISRDQARKIIEFDAGYAGQRVTFFEESKSSLSDLFTNWNVISWNDVKKIRVARPAATKSRVKQQDGDKYRGVIIHNRSHSWENKMMTTAGTAYYCSTSQWNDISYRHVPRGDFKLFFIPPSRQEAFKKKNPHAKSLAEYVKNRRDQIDRHVKSNKNVQSAIKYAWKMRKDDLDIKSITNDDFVTKYCLAKTGNKWMDLQDQYWRSSDSEFARYVTENYPLIADALVGYGYRNSYKHSLHAVQYINMIGENNDSA